MKRKLLFLISLLVFGACNKSDDAQNPTSGPVQPTPGGLLFSSGFESDTYISGPNEGYESNNWPDYDIIRGTDTSTGYSWPIQILGSDFGGIHKVNDDGGAAIDNSIEKVIGHDGLETTALFQRVNYDVYLTQTPYQINNIRENPDELYISYRMKTDDTSLNGPDKWRALWEYKTNSYGVSNNSGFRMISFMQTDSEGRPHWVFQGDTNPLNPVWSIENYDIPVLMNEWFKVEYYLKWSEGADGYASMKVNGQLIAEHSGPTTIGSNALSFIILTQVYGNSHPMHQWIDDIEIWNGVPN